MRRYHIFVIVVFFAGLAIFSQYRFDFGRAGQKRVDVAPSLQFIKAFDLGLHSAVASFFWIDVRTQLPFLPYGYKKFEEDFNLINDLDPKLSAPYEYAVLVVPDARNYPGKLERAVEIGEKGTRLGDANWKVPFYTGMDYHLYLKDYEKAAVYFDIAARTPGIPDIIQRFALNYGIMPSMRERTREIWRTLSETATDELIRERAKAYFVHFDMLLNLDAALNKYRADHNKKFPKSLEVLVEEGIISSVPRSPFGFDFMIYEKEGVVGIKPPATSTQNGAE